MLPPRARVRTPHRCGSLEASDRGRPHCHEHEQKDGCELLSTTPQFTTSGLSVALIYDDGQRNRLNKQDRRRPETARPDSAPLTSRNMKRSGWRSAKTDASCGEKTSANEKVPTQGLCGTLKNCQRLVLAESVRFELTDAFTSAVFKTAGLNHSPNSPKPVILCRPWRPTPRRAGTWPAGRSGSRGRARSAIRGTGLVRRGACARLLRGRAGSTSSPARCVR